MWHTLAYGRDLFNSVQYEDDFESSLPKISDTEAKENIGILRFFGADGITMSLLMEAFREGVDKKSRFGFTTDSIRAMQGLSLMHRLLRQYTEAESVLTKALALAHSAANTDIEFQLHILYEYGEFYLDQGNLMRAERKYLHVEKAIRQHKPIGTEMLHLQVFGSLTTLAIGQRRLQQAELLLKKAFGLSSELGYEES